MDIDRQSSYSTWCRTKKWVVRSILQFQFFDFDVDSYKFSHFLLDIVQCSFSATNQAHEPFLHTRLRYQVLSKNSILTGILRFFFFCDKLISAVCLPILNRNQLIVYFGKFSFLFSLEIQLFLYFLSKYSWFLLLQLFVYFWPKSTISSKYCQLFVYFLVLKQLFVYFSAVCFLFLEVSCLFAFFLKLFFVEKFKITFNYKARKFKKSKK